MATIDQLPLVLRRLDMSSGSGPASILDYKGSEETVKQIMTPIATRPLVSVPYEDAIAITSEDPGITMVPFGNYYPNASVEVSAPAPDWKTYAIIGAVALALFLALRKGGR